MSRLKEIPPEYADGSTSNRCKHGAECECHAIGVLRGIETGQRAAQAELARVAEMVRAYFETLPFICEHDECREWATREDDDRAGCDEHCPDGRDYGFAPLVRWLEGRGT